MCYIHPDLASLPHLHRWCAPESPPPSSSRPQPATTNAGSDTQALAATTWETGRETIWPPLLCSAPRQTDPRQCAVAASRCCLDGGDSEPSWNRCRCLLLLLAVQDLIRRCRAHQDRRETGRMKCVRVKSFPPLYRVSGEIFLRCAVTWDVGCTDSEEPANSESTGNIPPLGTNWFHSKPLPNMNHLRKQNQSIIFLPMTSANHTKVLCHPGVVVVGWGGGVFHAIFWHAVVFALITCKDKALAEGFHTWRIYYTCTVLMVDDVI